MNRTNRTKLIKLDRPFTPKNFNNTTCGNWPQTPSGQAERKQDRLGKPDKQEQLDEQNKLDKQDRLAKLTNQDRTDKPDKQDKLEMGEQDR